MGFTPPAEYPEQPKQKSHIAPHVLVDMQRNAGLCWLLWANELAYTPEN